VSGGALVVTNHLSIPRSELTFRASRAGGPGGQNVNKVSTRVELIWNLERSRVLDGDVRSRLRDKLASRLDGDGNVRIVASAFRSQLRNREDAEVRLAALIRKALVVPKHRRATRPTKGSVEQRLREKQHRSRQKRDRAGPRDDD
jgi:ribosome-associated protein